MSGILDYIRTNRKLFLTMDFLQEIFTIPTRWQLETLSPDSTKGQFTSVLTARCPMYEGKLFVNGTQFYKLVSWTRTDQHTTPTPTYQVVVAEAGIVYDPKENGPLVTPQTPLVISAGDIPSYKDPTPMNTTVGRYVANSVLFVELFDDKVPYFNREIKQRDYEKAIGDALLAKTVDPLKVKDVAIDNYYFLLSHPELYSPNLTEKSLTTSSEIPALRAKLVAERKERIDAGDPTAMQEVESQLIAADKAYLKDDPSIHFLISKKAFNNSRKKLLLTGGSIEVFGSPGQYTFVENPLAKGWKPANFPALVNESRLGSQSRALETAKGGEDAKFIGRVLQDLYVIEANCRTKVGMLEHLDKYTIGEQYDRYIMMGDGSEVLLTEDNASMYMDSTVMLRSAMHCRTKKGFCARCMGRTFEVLGQEALSAPAKSLSATFSNAALKKMHTSGVAVVKITGLNQFMAQN